MTSPKCQISTLELSTCDNYLPVTIFWPCPEVVIISDKHCTDKLLLQHSVKHPQISGYKCWEMFFLRSRMGAEKKEAIYWHIFYQMGRKMLTCVESFFAILNLLELKMTRKHEYSHDNTYFHLRHLLSGVYWLVNQIHAISFIVSRGCHPASKSGALTDGIHAVIRHAK